LGSEWLASLDGFNYSFNFIRYLCLGHVSSNRRRTEGYPKFFL